MAVDGFRMEHDQNKYWPLIVDSIMDDAGWSCEDQEGSQELTKFYFTVENSTDQPVGCIILTKAQIVRGPRAGHSLSTIGFFFVKSAYRTLGLGRWLFNDMLKDTDEDKFLTATPMMWLHYRNKHGFDKITDYQSHYLYTPNCAALSLDHFPVGPVPAGVQIRRWQDVEWERINSYVTKITYCDLDKLLRRNFAHPTFVTRVAVNSDGDVVGTCSVRIMMRAEVYIGPFYADNDQIARHLVRDALAEFLTKFRSHMQSNSKLALETASTNEAALVLYRDLIAGIPDNDGKYEMAACRVMFTRQIIDVPTDTIYSIASCAKTVA